MTRAALSLGILIAALFPAVPVAAAMEEDFLTFSDVTGQGIGCRPGTYNVTSNDKGRAFYVSFAKYRAETPSPEKPTAESSVDCTLTARIKQRPGFTYALTTVIYTGSARRDDKNATASLTGHYNFTGGGSSTPLTVPLAPTGAGDIEDFIGNINSEGDLVFQPCNSQRFLNIFSRLDVDGGPAGAYAMAEMGQTQARAVTLIFKEMKCD